METDRLRAFCTIVESGSMTRAAEVLGVSHSGLSKAIASLQDELGFKVFRAAGRGLELTPEGKDVYSRSRRILEMVNELRLPAAAELPLPRFGVPEAIGLVLAGPASRDLGPLIIEESDTGDLETQIAERRYDFGFTFVPFPRPDIEHLKIGTVTLRSFARPGVFKGHAPESIPYVVPSSDLKDNPLSLKIRDGWNPALARRTAFRTNSLSMAVEMARAGACAVYVPAFAIRRLNERVAAAHRLDELVLPAARRTAEASRRDIFLVKRKSDDESKTMKTAVRLVKQTCADHD